jgi:hypothetical protein
MVLGQALPLLAAIRAEAQAIFITEWIYRQAQDNGIKDGKFKIYLFALNIKDVLFIEINEIFILLT